MISFILQCNPGVGLKAFFDMVHLKPKKLILFGAACSPVTDQIAKAAKHWNLVQLTYADTHPMFTEKSFPHFYRVVPSENEFNPPRLSMLRYYNWTRVGTLYQNMAKYALVRAFFSLLTIVLRHEFISESFMSRCNVGFASSCAGIFVKSTLVTYLVETLI